MEKFTKTMDASRIIFKLKGEIFLAEEILSTAGVVSVVKTGTYCRAGQHKADSLRLRLD